MCEMCERKKRILNNPDRYEISFGGGADFVACNQQEGEAALRAFHQHDERRKDPTTLVPPSIHCPIDMMTKLWNGEATPAEQAYAADTLVAMVVNMRQEAKSNDPIESLLRALTSGNVGVLKVPGGSDISTMLEKLLKSQQDSDDPSRPIGFHPKPKKETIH